MGINWSTVGVITALVVAAGGFFHWLNRLIIQDLLDLRLKEFLVNDIRVNFVSKELIEGKIQLIEKRMEYLEAAYKELYEYSHTKGHDLNNINTTIGIMSNLVETTAERIDRLSTVIEKLEKNTTNLRETLLQTVRREAIIEIKRPLDVS